MKTEHTNKYKENNAELAKALVVHKKTIDEIQRESLKYRRAYFELNHENRLLKTQLNSVKKTVVDLIKTNTQNYTDVMQKLGIALTNNNLGSKSISSSASPNGMPVQCHSLDKVKRHVDEPIVPKKFAFEVTAEKKDHVESHEQKLAISTLTSDKQSCDQPNAELSQREPVCFKMFSSRFSLLKLCGFFKMDRTATTSNKQESNGIEQHGEDQPYNSINSVPKIIINSCLDGENGENKKCLVSHTVSENSVIRSPVGRKINYDEQVNTSLRELKKKRLSEKLSPVPDESNRNRIISPSIKSTAYNATKRSVQAHRIAQARLSDINKAKSPINESKSPTNNIQKYKVASNSITPSPNAKQQQLSIEPIAKLTNTSKQVDPNEGTSGASSQTSSSSDPSNVHSKSSKNKIEHYSNPLALLKRLQRRDLVSRTPKKFFSSPYENVTLSNAVSDKLDLDKLPQIDAPNVQYHSYQRVCDPLQKCINNNSEGTKENEEISNFKSFKSDRRSPLKTIPSPNQSQVSKKSLERSNVHNGSKSPNGNFNALKHQKSAHSIERQSDDSYERQVHPRTKSKEHVSIDDEPPSCSGRPRRHIAATNYAEPKLNIKMRRNI